MGGTFNEVDYETVEKAINCSSFYVSLIKMKKNEESEFEEKIKDLKKDRRSKAQFFIDKNKKNFFDRCASSDRDHVEDIIKRIRDPLYERFPEMLSRKLRHSSDKNSIKLDDRNFSILGDVLDDEFYQFYLDNNNRSYAIANPECIRSFSLSDSEEKTLDEKDNADLSFEIYAGIIMAVIGAFWLLAHLSN